MPNDRFAIRAEGLGKRYYLGQTVDLARNFRETLQTLPRWLGGKAVHKMRETLKPAAIAADAGKAGEGDAAEPGGRPAIWAVRDLNFTIEPGETVGIIGRNGSGKSTLLKILSRITWPTTGKAEIRGRIGSLLEVGTGFHPELTGRENVYLNGAILGMKNAEIQRKFDEIVAFSGVEKFLDTPVKRYSSGMRVRLAFAVAAHLETDVLVIDEVLAVGDAEFQQKCLGKMQDVAGGGRTVLFVSHNMQAVKQLCSRGILLVEGRATFDGTALDAIDAYVKQCEPASLSADIPPAMHYRPNPGLEIYRVEYLDSAGRPVRTVKMDERFSIAIDYRIRDAEQSYRIGLVVQSHDAVRLADSVNTGDNRPQLRGENGRAYRQIVEITNPFLSGRYQIDLTVKNQANEYVDAIQGIVFDVAAVSTEREERTINAGYIRLPCAWREPAALD